MQRVFAFVLVIALVSVVAAAAQEEAGVELSAPDAGLASPAPEAPAATGRGVSFVPPPPAEGQEGKGLAIVCAGDVSKAQAERVRAFVEQNMAVVVRALPPRDNAGGSLDDEGRAVASLVAGEVGYLVALVSPVEEIKAHGVFLPGDRVAIVNVAALRPEDGDEERHARRVERGTMQSFGMLLGLTACPNPQCVMWTYENMGELDTKGRNFCPPCLDALQRKAEKEGLTIVRESPFALPR